MLNEPWHPGTRYKSTTQYWIPSDSQENFQINSKDPAKYQLLVDHGWNTPTSIPYVINKHGFRCDEFETNVENVVTLGCSFTMGIGLPVETIWPSLVSQALGLKLYNLAWGGNSADTCFRLSEYWLPILKPSVVCMLTPPPTRVEIIDDNKDSPATTVLPGVDYDQPLFDIFLKTWFLHEENCRLNSLKNQLAIKQLCHRLNIKVVVLTALEDLEYDRTKIDNLARDFIHPGPEEHRELAKKFIEAYSNE
jgi:hypothetical protein